MESRREQQPKTRFDQQAALEELERFGREIQRYRAQRQALGDEFETFVRSLKAPTEPLPDAQPAVAQPHELPTFPVQVPTPPAADAAPPAEPAEQRPADATAPLPPIEVAPQPVDAVAQPVVIAAPGAVPAPRRPQTPAVAVAAGVILVGGIVLTALLLNRGPEPAADTAAPSESAAVTSAPGATATPAAPADAPATAPAPPPVTPAPAQSAESAIVTERQVWMRVIVDGNRVLEREVPAGTRIPLKAEKTIVIRTGDAGAVRLSLRGAPGELLGREGEVVTRTIAVPPRAPAAR